jgi:hypothetical protein
LRPFYYREPDLTKVVFVLFVGIVGLIFFPAAGWSQEFFLYGGKMEETDFRDSGTVWGLAYFQTVGDHFALSLTHLNEGHVPGHHRDGYTPQAWVGADLFQRQLSLAAGIGPYFYFDTRFTDQVESVDNHGLGIIYSAALTWHTKCGLLFQLRGNWIEVKSDFSHLSVIGGLGYRLDPLVEDRAGPARPKGRITENEITLSVGDSVLNGAHADHTLAAALEYRRGVHPYLDVTIGVLTEDPNTNHRYGVVGQLWAVRRAFGDRVSFGVGIGPYLAHDKSGMRGTQRLNGALGLTGAVMLGEHLLVRGTWQRVATPHDHDADIFLGGLGWRF